MSIILFGYKQPYIGQLWLSNDGIACECTHCSRFGDFYVFNLKSEDKKIAYDSMRIDVNDWFRFGSKLITERNILPRIQNEMTPQDIEDLERALFLRNNA